MRRHREHDCLEERDARLDDAILAEFAREVCRGGDDEAQTETMISSNHRIVCFGNERRAGDSIASESQFTFEPIHPASLTR